MWVNGGEWLQAATWKTFKKTFKKIGEARRNEKMDEHPIYRHPWNEKYFFEILWILCFSTDENVKHIRKLLSRIYYRLDSRLDAVMYRSFRCVKTDIHTLMFGSCKYLYVCDVDILFNMTLQQMKNQFSSGKYKRCSKWQMQTQRKINEADWHLPYNDGFKLFLKLL